MEYQLYAQVAEEIEQGQKEPGVWAKAFANAKGDEQKTKAIYIELMVERLALAQQSTRELEEQSEVKELTESPLGNTPELVRFKLELAQDPPPLLAPLLRAVPPSSLPQLMKVRGRSKKRRKE